MSRGDAVVFRVTGHARECVPSSLLVVLLEEKPDATPKQGHYATNNLQGKTTICHCGLHASPVSLLLPEEENLQLQRLGRRDEFPLREHLNTMQHGSLFKKRFSKRTKLHHSIQW